MAAQGTPQEDLGEIYKFAIQIAKDAGNILMAGVEKRCSDEGAASEEQVEKDSSVDIVTKTDQEVEASIYAAIRAKYPNHKFVGEESYSAGATRDYLIDDAPTWCVDPLDGTVNYTHLFPMFCVSVGFVVGREAVVGVVYAPFLGQLFSACRGRGAWLNETQRLPLVRSPQVPAMPPQAPKGCVFSCEWGKDRRDGPEGNLRRKVESFVNMAAEVGGRDGLGGMVHGVRCLGSAALDLAYTAMGSFDIWWEGGCWEWDVAAGIAILQEAGGLVTTANPPQGFETASIPEVSLGSRLYLAIRPAGPSPTETGRQSQERVVREVWKRVKSLNYTRPGI
ncbi:hypothetical protein GGTG_00382 [Gaeumannomyces tritici R3-111a-1]|uniref:Inositol-1-monophosphatase n=1 Tax=Gaeumannomyces tritici (strain R3-111a-1) TaxID=644352 RepID=J3NGJ2_GAET3|nr:hypothetical protein GGTG_00382 [Gaeumannomyces tritici R3-111a-1]EJT80382.1 hypothetical protein GGTG_00382 [Gaeumannomyces tritici R3-111a-1]